MDITIVNLERYKVPVPWRFETPPKDFTRASLAAAIVYTLAKYGDFRLPPRVGYLALCVWQSDPRGAVDGLGAGRTAVQMARTHKLYFNMATFGRVALTDCGTAEALRHVLAPHEFREREEHRGGDGEQALADLSAKVRLVASCREVAEEVRTGANKAEDANGEIVRLTPSASLPRMRAIAARLALDQNRLLDIRQILKHGRPGGLPEAEYEALLREKSDIESRIAPDVEELRLLQGLEPRT